MILVRTLVLTVRVFTRFTRIAFRVVREKEFFAIPLPHMGYMFQNYSL